MEKLSIISTVRAPVSDLLAFVDFHLDQGIDHIVLFFDDPEDPAVEELASRREVTCVKCTDAYWRPHGQRPETVEERFIANLNDGVPIAIRNGCSWIAHIDSDELVYPVSQLRPLINESEVDAIRFTIMEAVPESDVDDSVFATNLFKRLSSPELISKASSQGVSTAFFQGEYFRGHSASKTLIKISPKIIELGNHAPKKVTGDFHLKHADNVFLLHFDCVGYSNWRRKWEERLDGTGTAVALRKNRAAQLDLYAATREQGEEALMTLYRRMHMIPDHEKRILFDLGMLTILNFKDHPRKVI